MASTRTRSERLRALGAASLAVFYLVAFVPLLVKGPAVYFSWFFIPQMLAGIGALWLNPRELPHRSSRVRRAVTASSDRDLVHTPRD